MSDDQLQNPRDNELRRQRWVVLGVVVLLLGAVAMPLALREETVTAPLKLPPPQKPSPVGQFRGMTLQLHTNSPAVPFEQYVKEIASSGANTIIFTVAAYQENPSASSVFIEYRRVPPADRIARLIRLSRSLGLRVVMMPMVLLERPIRGEWRGKIRPMRPDDWWKDYENYVLYYARISHKTGAEMFMVGSELVSMEGETDRWKGLIAKVRKAYPNGLLGYSANWDHYKDIRFWDALDVIGMTAYYDLVGTNKPTLERLVTSWKPIRKKILDWKATIDPNNTHRIVFTEVGWPSQVGCAREPWNYFASPIVDLKTQDLCFQAFFKTWQDDPAVGGILIWEWRNGPGQHGGPLDRSYVPINKPAMETIRAFYRSPGALTRPASRPASQPGATPVR